MIKFFRKIKPITIFICLALSFLMFTLGGIYTYLKPRDNIFIQSYQALRALHSIAVVDFGRIPTTEVHDVVKYDKNKAFNGYTLFAMKTNPTAFLVDMEGKVVHKWDLNVLNNIFKEFSFDKTPKSLVDVQLSSNGDILAVISEEGKTPWGAGVVKADRDGNILWLYDKQKAHHDLSLDENDNIYVLTNEFIKERPKGKQRFKDCYLPVMDDRVTVLSPNGQEIKSFSLLDALFNSSEEIYTSSQVKQLHTDLIFTGSFYTDWLDFTHANTIHYITKEMADTAEFLNPGEVLICIRNLNLLVAVDVDREVVTWSKTGPWHRPHDPELLPNGNLLVFDNLSQYPVSRVIEFNPQTDEVVWVYQGTESRPLHSEYRGRNIPLKNGNILITETQEDRILEITRKGEIVWEYANIRPIDKKYDISFAYRFEKQDLKFLTDQ